MNKIRFLTNIVIAHLPGIIGSYFTVPSIKIWYAHLNKPSFNPPNWIFSPVWLTLYTLIGIAFYYFHKKNQFRTKKTYFLYGIHLFLNAIWSILFFKMHMIGAAALELIFMIVTLVLLMKIMNRESVLSARLLVPYLVWITFALVLNINIYLLN